MRFAPSEPPFLDIVARMKCNEIRGTEPPSISLCAIETTKSTLYAVFWPTQVGCEGKTGNPIADAAMRKINQTGFMHNRLRMIVASFLVKDLLIDWRWDEKYFADNLNDFDLAANSGGWQWAASTGYDAQPYCRRITIRTPF